MFPLDRNPEWVGDCPSRMELVDTSSGALPVANQKLIWRRGEARIATDVYTSAYLHGENLCISKVSLSPDTQQLC